MIARASVRALAGLTLAFLVLPLLVIIPISFSNSPILAFPPPGFSTRWYHAFFGSAEWTGALQTSLKVGVVVALLSTTLGYLAAVAVTQERMGQRYRSVLRGTLLVPLVIPVIVIAIAIYGTYSDLHLIGTTIGVILAQTVLALPITFIILEARLGALGRQFSLASESLGANWLQTTWYVTLPLVRPALLAAFIFGFFTSFDEVVIVNFISGTTAVTLPKLMFSYLRTELEPTIASVASLLIGVWIVGFIGLETAVAVRARREARSLDAAGRRAEDDMRP